MTDQYIIESILSGGYSMQRTIETFYHENYGYVYKMMASHKLSKDETQDAYSDSVTSFAENIRDHKFRGDSRCSTYFVRIFNNKCIDVIRKKTTNKSMINTISIEDMKQEFEQTGENNAETLNLVGFMNELSEICREVLMDWSDGFSMDEVAERNALKNAHTARSKRYNCFQQLIEILMKKNVVDSNLKLIADGD